MMRWLIAAYTITFLGFTPHTNAQSSPWPMFRHDAQHTGRTVYTGPATPVYRWHFQANDAITSSPAIGQNGSIYIGAGGYFGGGKDSSVYALNPDGSLRWQFKTDRFAEPQLSAGIFSSPAISDNGTIYIASLDGHLYSLDDSTTYAKLNWKAPTSWAMYSSPMIGPNNRVYVGSLDFFMYCFDLDGNQIWNYRTGWCVFSSPALGYDNNIYVGSKDHNLYRWSPTSVDGLPDWNYATGTFYDGHLVDCSPAIGDDGTIYFGTDPYGASGQFPVPIDTAFYAVNPDGSLKWCLEIGRTVGIESTPAIGHDGTIYVGSYDSCLYAIEDADTAGIVKWVFPTGGLVDASPTVDGDGTVYIGSNDSVMYAVHPDGSLKWSYQTQGRIESSVTIDADGNIYFGNFDGKLYCLGTGAPDVGVVAADRPGSLNPGNDYTPSATLANFRRADQTCNVTCRILADNVSVYFQTISAILLTDAERQVVNFPPWTVAGETGTVYTIVYETILSEDDNIDNDRLTVQITSCCQGRVGDVNHSGEDEPTIGDVSLLIDVLFISLNPDGLACLAEADINQSGGAEPVFDDLTIGDISLLIDYLFITGPSLGLNECL